LSTEAGGAGLNLQIADTLINFELPWNPAKKNQRIGRIDRIGQKSGHLTIYNLITHNSIEQQIAAGLLVKQNLFEGVLDNNSKMDYVDFSSKGRSQFIEQLEAFLNQPLEEEMEFAPSSQAAVAETEDDLTDDYVLMDSENDDDGPIDSTEKNNEAKTKPSENEEKIFELEQVMTSGMQFLAGLYKMSTGKESDFENQKIKVNKETGEVTMTFRLPI